MSDETFDKSKVLGRVKKMMALANDRAASEGERDNALRMAHATLAKYNLSMAEAETTGSASLEDRVLGQHTLNAAPWMRTVASGVAKLFFCEFFYTNYGRGHIKFVFVGRDSNAQTAIQLTQFVIRSIVTEGRRTGRELNDGTWVRSFCKGAATRVYWRCVEIQRNAEAASAAAPSTGTSLVLASVYQREQEANELMLQKLGVKLKTTKSKQRDSRYDAYAAGSQYGDSIGLHPQIK